MNVLIKITSLDGKHRSMIATQHIARVFPKTVDQFTPDSFPGDMENFRNAKVALAGKTFSCIKTVDGDVIYALQTPEGLQNMVYDAQREVIKGHPK